MSLELSVKGNISIQALINKIRYEGDMCENVLSAIIYSYFKKEICRHKLLE